ncbi:hypothetical protein LSCM4_05302 [Leishmania orientalis]|uniref:Uncharacterized protein n=1 Tax=Leishmania orientalis TaxID=2249476 RepID=A0A836HJD2_9TRYP|nr:hypothetical protein LSCM4_05302 [Leishmania orientalis]
MASKLAKGAVPTEAAPPIRLVGVLRGKGGHRHIGQAASARLGIHLGMRADDEQKHSLYHSFCFPRVGCLCSFSTLLYRCVYAAQLTACTSRRESRSALIQRLRAIVNSSFVLGAPKSSQARA